MHNSSIICVDANILIRLTLKPNEGALQQMWDSWMAQEYTLIAPTLLYYEITNGLYRLQKSGLLSPAFVRDALDFAFALPIRLIGDVALHQRALELAATYRLPAAYDAHYLALAERLGVELWTSDVRLVSALQPFGVDWVKLAGA